MRAALWCLLCGCGRIGFDPFGATGGGDGGGGDTAMPIVDGAPCSTDNDCGRCGRCDGNVCAPAGFGTVDLGHQNSCAIDSIGDVWCWGENAYYIQGLVGSGPPTYLRPRRIGIHNATEISVGWGIGLARTSDGALWGWGQYNGVGGAIAMLDPTDQWSNLSAEMFDACARGGGGQVYCVGENSYGQLGRGTAMMFQILPLAPLTGANFLSASADGVACGLRDDHTLFCVGRNADGELGRGTTTPYELALGQVGAVGEWNAVSVGDRHVCAIRSDGTLWCWGVRFSNGDTADHSSPNMIDARTDWQWVDSDYGISCAMRASEIWCWGYNELFMPFGTSGNNTPFKLPISPDPGTVPVLGGYAMCIKQGGAWTCWGRNVEGEVGVDSTAAMVDPQLLCP